MVFSSFPFLFATCFILQPLGKTGVTGTVEKKEPIFVVSLDQKLTEELVESVQNHFLAGTVLDDPFTES